MDMPARDDKETFDPTVFLSHFKEPRESRQPGRAIYPRYQVLLLVPLVHLAGAEAFTGIARFGER